MSKIHAMSDDQYEEFEDSSMTGYEREQQAFMEIPNEWIVDGLVTPQAWLDSSNPENEDNYDDCAEPEDFDGVPDCDDIPECAYADCCELWGLSSDMPRPEDIGFDPNTDCQNPF